MSISAVAARYAALDRGPARRNGPVVPICACATRGREGHGTFPRCHVSSIDPPGPERQRGTMGIDWHTRLETNPEVRSGQPTIRGMRVTVRDVLGFLAAGMTVDEILTEYPYLERDDILAALAYATETLPDHVPA